MEKLKQRNPWLVFNGIIKDNLIRNNQPIDQINRKYYAKKHYNNVTPLQKRGLYLLGI